MTFILTLVGDAEKSPLTSDVVEGLRTSLRLTAAPLDWLCPGIACDIRLPYDSGFDSLIARDWARSLLKDHAIDANCVWAEDRRKRLLIADMDSTIIEQECLDELAEVAGIGDRIKPITERAMRGEIDFVPALKERVALLRGLPAAVIDRVIAERISFRPGGRTLVQTMNAHGAFTALVSGGFSQFTNHVAREVGFAFNRANELILDGAVLSGMVREPALGKNAKVEALRSLAADLGISPAEAVTVGDGANDIPMLGASGLGVAFHAKPKVREAAHSVIDHADLTALLYLQGYRREEFRT